MLVFMLLLQLLVKSSVLPYSAPLQVVVSNALRSDINAQPFGSCRSLRSSMSKPIEVLGNIVNIVTGEGPNYFRECALAGALSCSLSHSLMIPVDNLKTKMQVSEALKNMRTHEALTHLLKVDGWKTLTKGKLNTAAFCFQSLRLSTIRSIIASKADVSISLSFVPFDT